MTNKYKARKTRIDGYTFDSVAEASRYRELKLLEKAGAISNLIVHPRFELFPQATVYGKVLSAIHYTADFEYLEDGRRIVEDVKGIMTRDAVIRINLFQRLYPDIEMKLIYQTKEQ